VARRSEKGEDVRGDFEEHAQEVNICEGVGVVWIKKSWVKAEESRS